MSLLRGRAVLLPGSRNTIKQIKNRSSRRPFLLRGDDPDYPDPGFDIGTPGANRSPWFKCVPETFVIQTFGVFTVSVTPTTDRHP
jgi:hypothetical protein